MTEATVTLRWQHLASVVGNIDRDIGNTPILEPLGIAAEVILGKCEHMPEENRSGFFDTAVDMVGDIVSLAAGNHFGNLAVWPAVLVWMNIHIVDEGESNSHEFVINPGVCTIIPDIINDVMRLNANRFRNQSFNEIARFLREDEAILRAYNTPLAADEVGNINNNMACRDQHITYNTLAYGRLICQLRVVVANYITKVLTQLIDGKYQPSANDKVLTGIQMFIEKIVNPGPDNPHGVFVNENTLNFWLEHAPHGEEEARKQTFNVTCGRVAAMFALLEKQKTIESWAISLCKCYRHMNGLLFER